MSMLDLKYASHVTQAKWLDDCKKQHPIVSS